ncbi:hypothetical protein GAY28_23700 [Azospirillum brasilense]|nr:hypothetical protein [Azospirillum brasilense]
MHLRIKLCTQINFIEEGTCGGMMEFKPRELLTSLVNETIKLAYDYLRCVYVTYKNPFGSVLRGKRRNDPVRPMNMHADVMCFISAMLLYLQHSGSFFETLSSIVSVNGDKTNAIVFIFKMIVFSLYFVLCCEVVSYVVARIFYKRNASFCAYIRLILLYSFAATVFLVNSFAAIINKVEFDDEFSVTCTAIVDKFYPYFTSCDAFEVLRFLLFTVSFLPLCLIVARLIVGPYRRLAALLKHARIPSFRNKYRYCLALFIAMFFAYFNLVYAAAGVSEQAANWVEAQLISLEPTPAAVFEAIKYSTRDSVHSVDHWCAASDGYLQAIAIIHNSGEYPVILKRNTLGLVLGEFNRWSDNKYSELSFVDYNRSIKGTITGFQDSNNAPVLIIEQKKTVWVRIRSDDKISDEHIRNISENPHGMLCYLTYMRISRDSERGYLPLIRTVYNDKRFSHQVKNPDDEPGRIVSESMFNYLSTSENSYLVNPQ